MIKTDGWLRRTGLLISLAAAPLAGGSAAQAEDAPIKIGMAVAQSGWIEAYDGEGTKMAQLWIKQQNAKGGLLGHQINVEIGDTKTDRAEGAKVGQSLSPAAPICFSCRPTTTMARPPPSRPRRPGSFRYSSPPPIPRPASSASARSIYSHDDMPASSRPPSWPTGLSPKRG